MAGGFSGAGDEVSTDRMSARTPFTRRRWTVQQKRLIVSESLEAGVSTAVVARKHGISAGQLYRWRQQLLHDPLRTAADTTQSFVRLDLTGSAPRLEAAIPGSPAADLPATPIAPLPTRADQASATDDAPVADRSSVLSEPVATMVERGQANRPTDATPHGASACALRGFGETCRPRRSPVPRQQLLELVCPGAAGDDAPQHVGQPAERFDSVQLCRRDQGHRDRPVLGAAVGSGKEGVLASQSDRTHAAFHHVGVCALIKVHCSPRRKSGPANSRSSRKPSGRIRRRRMV